MLCLPYVGFLVYRAWRVMGVVGQKAYQVWKGVVVVGQTILPGVKGGSSCLKVNQVWMEVVVVGQEAFQVCRVEVVVKASQVWRV